MKMDGDVADSLKPQHMFDDKCVSQPPFRLQPEKININKHLHTTLAQVHSSPTLYFLSVNWRQWMAPSTTFQRSSAAFLVKKKTSNFIFGQNIAHVIIVP